MKPLIICTALTILSFSNLAFSQNIRPPESKNVAPRKPSSTDQALPKKLAALNDLRVEVLALGVQKRKKTNEAFELIGDLSSSGHLDQLTDPQLRSFLSVLVTLSENDEEAQSGPVVQSLISTYGDKIHKMIHELDKNHSLKNAYKAVSNGKL